MFNMFKCVVSHAVSSSDVIRGAQMNSHKCLVDELVKACHQSDVLMFLVRVWEKRGRAHVLMKCP